MTTSECGSASTQVTPRATAASEERFTTNPELLEERGRVQFFFHSPVSDRPIRDVTNEQDQDHKTEPFLEQNAENYCSECYQSNNIIPFLKSTEKYLFLQTTCKNESLDQYDERYIVGYLEKERALDMGTHFAVQGPISLFAFDDGYPGSKLECDTEKPRMYTLDHEETARVLAHFTDKKDIYEECLAATVELEDQIDRNAGVPVPDEDPLFDDPDDPSGC